MPIVTVKNESTGEEVFINTDHLVYAAPVSPFNPNGAYKVHLLPTAVEIAGRIEISRANMNALLMASELR